MSESAAHRADSTWWADTWFSGSFDPSVGEIGEQSSRARDGRFPIGGCGSYGGPASKARPGGWCELQATAAET
jgi:hypothetical protein